MPNAPDGQMKSVFFYPDEQSILELRKNFRLTADGYLSRGSLLYIIETAKDLSNNENLENALVAKAAYILLHIITTHPFIDGNKRTAFGTAKAFLLLNDHSIKVNEIDGSQFIVEIAADKVKESQVRTWIRQHLKKLDS
jgi:death-on-curing protein